MQAGYEVIFMAPQSRFHGQKRVTDWIVDKAKELGIKRVTKRLDAEGSGAGGHLHSWHFFELADQPVEVMFVLEVELADRLIDAVKAEGVHVFCVRKPVDFGELGRD